MTTIPPRPPMPPSWTATAKHVTERTGDYGIPYEQEKIRALDATGRLNPVFVPPVRANSTFGKVSGISNSGPEYGGKYNRLDGFNIDAAMRARSAPKSKKLVGKKFVSK